MNFVLNRNHTHRSTMGHVISFKKGEPVYVPPVCRKEVVALGAECTDEAFDSAAEALGEEKHVAPELTPVERAQKMREAFEVLLEKNQRQDFTGGGMPTPRAIERETQLVVDRTELTPVWLAYKEEKALEGK